jgi:hypothetical protein
MGHHAAVYLANVPPQWSIRIVKSDHAFLLNDRESVERSCSSRRIPDDIACSEHHDTKRIHDLPLGSAGWAPPHRDLVQTHTLCIITILSQRATPNFEVHSLLATRLRC